MIKSTSGMRHAEAFDHVLNGGSHEERSIESLVPSIARNMIVQFGVEAKVSA